MNDTTEDVAQDGVAGRADRADAPAVSAAETARARLQALDDAPLDEHVEVYEDVHRQLQEGLADLDEG